MKKIVNKWTINLVLYPLFIIIGSSIFYKITYGNISLSFHFLSFLLTYIFFTCLFLLLLAIFNNSKISKIILLVISTVLLTVCAIKYTIMDIPLELSDVLDYLNPAGMSQMKIATGSIGIWIIKVLIQVILYIIIGLLFIIYDKKIKIKISNIWIRIITFIVSLIIILLPFICINRITNYSIKNIYRINNIDEVQNWKSDKIYHEYGFYQGLYLNELLKKGIEPTGYSSKKIESYLKEAAASKEDATWPKSNVVIILSEAFSDIQRIDEVKFNKSLMPNIDRYATQKDKIVTDLLVSTFGGGSTNSEFEVLTGGSIQFMYTSVRPYLHYYNDDNGSIAPNLIKEFNNNGYETMYFSPWGGSSYHSKYVYNKIGTDKTYYNYDKGTKKGIYLSDISIMDGIYKELESTSKDNYKFIMAATSQNHFPYNEGYDSYDIEVVSSKYNDEDTEILKNYAQGIYDADASLEYLYQKIKKLEVPTVIVFFGDHLPYTVDSKGNNPYTDSKFFNTKNKDLNNIRKYTTKAVILANYKLKTDQLNYINSSYLGAYVINKMDIEISDYFKYVDYERKQVPVFNRDVVYQDNKTIKWDKSNLKDNIMQYKYVQYNAFYDYK